jgi:chromosomal replication initiation ATPase DnaA
MRILNLKERKVRNMLREDRSLVALAVSELMDEINMQLDIEEFIISTTCVIWNITEEKLKSGSRKRIHVDPRHYVSHKLTENSSLTSGEIGDVTKRSHCSVLASVKEHKNLMENKKYKLNALIADELIDKFIFDRRNQSQ